MKKVLFIALVLAMVPVYFSCEENKKDVIKTMTQTRYSTKIENEVYVKDTILEKFSIGNYPNGNQQFSIVLIGYNNQDTTWYDNIELQEEKENNHTYIYGDGKLIEVLVKNQDTTFFYYPEQLDSPNSYTIEDSKGVIEYCDLSYFYSKRYFLEREFDKKGVLIKALIKEDKYPYGYEQEEMSELELNVYLRQHRKYIIIENEYTYY